MTAMNKAECEQIAEALAERIFKRAWPSETWPPNNLVHANDIIEKFEKIAESEKANAPNLERDNCMTAHGWIMACNKIAEYIRALKSSLPAETVSEAMVEQARLIIANAIKCNGFVKSSGLCVRGTLEKHCDCRDAARQILVLAPADDGWQPIESAPRIPGKAIDLWVVPGKSLVGERWKPYRETDAHLSGNGKHWLTKTGHYIEGLRYHDHFNRDDRGHDATVVTHYCLPAPPVGDR